jgi:hypothetical protein
MCAMPVHLGTQDIVGGSSGVSGDMSLTINSLYKNIDEAVSYSVQASMTGSPLGVIQLEASNDIVPSSAQAPVNWTVIQESVAAVTGAGTYMVNYSLPSYTWVRLVYNPTSGSGAMYTNLNTKRR